MLIHPGDARRFHCPLKLAAERLSDDGGATHCAGSECMAWRWIDGREDSGLGYCGIAGKTEG